MGVDIDTHKQSTLESRQREAEFRAVFEGAALGIALTDLNGRPVKCNRALERILGYSEAELRGMVFPEFTHPEDVQADLDLFRRLLAAEIDNYHLEKRYLRKDGQVVWAHLTVFLVRPQEGEPQFVMGMVEDITAHKAAQEALRESQEKFYKAFHGNPTPTMITRRADGTVLEANRAFLDWFRVSAEEARKMTVFDFGFWISSEERAAFLKQIQEQGAIRDYQKVITLPSGENRVALLAIEPIRIGTEDCLLAISTDLTQQRKAESALQRSDERLRRGMQAARMGTWEWDIATDQMTGTEGVLSLLGLSPGAFGGTLEAFFKLVAEGDRERVEREFKEALSNPDRKYYSELRVCWPDSSVHWVEARGEVRRDASGNPFRMLGTLVCVTDRKRAEMALRSSEESLRATVANTPHVAIQWYDPAGRILFWNQASEAMFGWKAGDADGKTLDQLIFDAEESDRFMRALKDVERTGKPAPAAEYRFHRRDGGQGVCLSTLFRIPRGADNFCFVCMDVDLTERKRIEQSLREAQQRELLAREEFTRQLLNAEEQERQRLAAELHDGIGQNLSVIHNSTYLALAKPGLPPEVRGHLNTVQQFTSQSIDELRDLVRNLRPLQIEQLGLTDAVRALLENVSRATSIQIDHQVDEVDDMIQGSAATHVYRIVQEALNNLVKHSGADRASIRLERDVDCVRLRVSDSGGGFAVEEISVQAGFGLRSISERAQMLGGTSKIESLPGAGTQLVVELPISKPEAPGT